MLHDSLDTTEKVEHGGEQLRLFEVKAQPYKTLRSPLSLTMTRPQLLGWQTEIAEFQRSLQREVKPVQQSLFEPAVTDAISSISPEDSGQLRLGAFAETERIANTPQTMHPERLNPWMLSYQAMSFWRKPATTRGYPCIYFVADRFVPIVLYIGESNNSERRWRSEHDCKHYLDRYYALHYDLGIEHGVAIAFWLHAPRRRKARQELEQALIQLWKPPFNKECWSRWGQPFGRD